MVKRLTLTDPWELLRRVLVYGCALSLIAACSPLPGPL
jgi:hypothetical protein